MSVEIILIAPLSAPSRRPRLAKMISTFVETGHQVRFYGWERACGEMKTFAWEDKNVQEKAILKGGGQVSSKTRAMYPLWMLAVFFCTLSLGRGQRIFCLGWETAFPALLASFFTSSQIVFDDADRFSMIIKLPNALTSVLQMLERWTSRNSALHIVPSMSRYDWQGPNMFILQNTPTSKDIMAAERLAPQRVPARLVVYANGWLMDTRGAPTFYKSLEILEDRGIAVRMHVAGMVDDNSMWGRKLISHKSVIFHGELPQREALALYLTSDVALTFYDPDIPINRKAESNKWGDCICLRTPFIVNEEVETATLFVRAGAAWAVPYHNPEALADFLELLSSNRQKLHEGQEACRALQRVYTSFDEQVKKLLEKLAF